MRPGATVGGCRGAGRCGRNVDAGDDHRLRQAEPPRADRPGLWTRSEAIDRLGQHEPARARNHFQRNPQGPGRTAADARCGPRTGRPRPGGQTPTRTPRRARPRPRRGAGRTTPRLAGGAAGPDKRHSRPARGRAPRSRGRPAGPDTEVPRPMQRGPQRLPRRAGWRLRARSSLRMIDSIGTPSPCPSREGRGAGISWKHHTPPRRGAMLPGQLAISRGSGFPAATIEAESLSHDEHSYASTYCVWPRRGRPEAPVFIFSPSSLRTAAPWRRLSASPPLPPGGR